MTGNEKTKFTLAGIVVGHYGVEVHPEFWEDLKNAPEEIQEAAKELIEHMRTAARICSEKYGPYANEQHFTEELMKLTGQEPEMLNEEDLKLIDEIEQRHGNFPTKH